MANKTKSKDGVVILREIKFGFDGNERRHQSYTQ